MVRLLVIVIDKDLGANEKTHQAFQWILGIVLLSVAWVVLGAVFGTDVGKIGGKGTTNSGSGYFQSDNTKVNSNDYYGNEYQDKTDTVNIKINTGN
jgi:hypothetical protein